MGITVNDMLNAANADLGLTATPVDINSPTIDYTGYTNSLPDWTAGPTIDGASADGTPSAPSNSIGIGSFLSSLLNYNLQKAQISAQTQLALAGRSGYPVGTRTAAPALAGGSGMTGMIVIGALVFLGLHFAKAA